MMFRVMQRSDIPQGLSLCRSAGWNQLSRDWEIFLKLDPQGSKVCVYEDRSIAGTVATIRYGKQLAWIGMILVDPTHRHQGIGTRLLQEACMILHDESCIKLDATPAGRQVYLKLGFKDEYPLSRMLATTTQINLPGRGPTVSPLAAGQFASLALFDRLSFGADRSALLSWMFEGAPELSFTVQEGSRCTGYCMGRYGHNFTHIGPVVASNIDVAKALLATALPHCGNAPVIIDVPQHDASWISWLGTMGFSAQRPFIRMVQGRNTDPGLEGNQFAILGPEFG